MLGPAVAGEVEDGLLAEAGSVHVACVDQQLVALGLRAGDDDAVGVDDQAAADQGMAVLDAGLDRKSTRLNSSHVCSSRMPSSA